MLAHTATRSKRPASRTRDIPRMQDSILVAIYKSLLQIPEIEYGGPGDRREVELVPEGGRCHDVLNPELGYGNLRARHSTNRRNSRQPDAGGALSASVRPRPSVALNGFRPEGRIAGFCGSLTPPCAPRGRSPPPTAAGRGMPGSLPPGARSRPRPGTRSRSE